MTQAPHFQDPQQVLRHLLDVYGADRSRWPAAERLQLASFIASDPRARVELAEAAALDAVLDRAPSVSAAREPVLLARIARAVSADGVPRPQPIAMPTAVQSVKARKVWLLPATALMAACLMLGIVSGSSTLFSPVVDAVADVMGLGTGDSEIVSASDVLHGSEEAL